MTYRLVAGQRMVLLAAPGSNVEIMEQEGKLFAVSKCCTVNAGVYEDRAWWVCGSCKVNMRMVSGSPYWIGVYDLSHDDAEDSRNLREWLSYWSGHAFDDIRVRVDI